MAAPSHLPCTPCEFLSLSVLFVKMGPTTVPTHKFVVKINEFKAHLLNVKGSRETLISSDIRERNIHTHMHTYTHIFLKSRNQYKVVHRIYEISDPVLIPALCSCQV